MLQKCANPTCSVQFRSLREGKLFLSEVFLLERNDADATRRSPRRREYFWLCEACSYHFTLRFDHDGTMMTVPLPRGGEIPVAAD